MTITLNVAGGSFELAEDYRAEKVMELLESDHAGRLTFRLADGGEAHMRVALGCDWSVETHV
jgi:hypothetical protein